jgi:serine/threonine protein kinase
MWQAEFPGGGQGAVEIWPRAPDPEGAKRQFQVLERLRGLRHPFLLQIQAYWVQEDRVFIFTELPEGDLRGHFQDGRRSNPAGIRVNELIPCMREAAEALDYLHREKVIHRDVKPDNIFLVHGHAKLGGLAFVHPTGSGAVTVGTGTPVYMAPEVWPGQVSEHTDQYALAVTYAELRLGRRLFSGQTLFEVMEQQLKHTPDLSPLPGAEQKAVLKALAKQEQHRYASCIQFVQALEQAVAG